MHGFFCCVHRLHAYDEAGCSFFCLEEDLIDYCFEEGLWLPQFNVDNPLCPYLKDVPKGNDKDRLK